MSRIDCATHVCEIVTRYFAQFAEDRENMPFDSFESWAKDFIAWDKEEELEAEMIHRIASDVEILSLALYNEF